MRQSYLVLLRFLAKSTIVGIIAISPIFAQNASFIMDNGGELRLEIAHTPHIDSIAHEPSAFPSTLLFNPIQGNLVSQNNIKTGHNRRQSLTPDSAFLRWESNVEKNRVVPKLRCTLREHVVGQYRICPSIGVTELL